MIRILHKVFYLLKLKMVKNSHIDFYLLEIKMVKTHKVFYLLEIKMDKISKMFLFINLFMVLFGSRLFQKRLRWRNKTTLKVQNWFKLI